MTNSIFNIMSTTMKHHPYDKILLFVVFWVLLWGYLNSCLIINGKLFSAESHDVENKINVFILAGQSNMAGRGGVTNKVWDGFVPLESLPDPRILQLNKDFELQVAKEPLHDGIDVNKTCGVGPGMSFANGILRKDPNFGTIILVPSAVGGTSIREWSSFNSSLRANMIERTNAALRYGGKLRAILWYQGEKDTETEEGALMYASEYKTFIHLLYQELNYPQVPFIQVALASGQGELDWLEHVRAVQLGMDGITSVDGLGLALQPDCLHLTTMAQVRLGKMLADAFLNSRT